MEAKHGRTWKQKIVEFGEQVLGKLAPRRAATKMKTRTVHRNKMASRWVKGTWVGMVDRSHESILVAAAGRAVRVRTIRRRPFSERWNLQAIEDMNATPRRPIPGSEATEPEAQHTGEEQGAQQEEPRATRGEDVLPRV